MVRGAVLGHRRAVVCRDRRVVDTCDRHGHRCSRSAVEGVGERVAAAEVSRRGVRDIGTAVGHGAGAMRRLTDRCHGHGAAVRIRVIRQDIDRGGAGVLHDAGGVVRRGGGIVHGIDGDRDRRGVRVGRPVVGPIGEGRRAVEVGCGRERE